MKEELTTQMHGELSMSPDTDKAHRIASARTVLSFEGFSPAEVAAMYWITKRELSLPDGKADAGSTAQ
jgi:hypothetical protein